MPALSGLRAAEATGARAELASGAAVA